MRRERHKFRSIYKLASARHQAVYTGPDLLRHLAPTTFQAKIDAEGWLREERKLIEASEWSPPRHRAEKERAVAKTPDFETYVKKGIAKCHTDKGEPPRASTRANYEATPEHHLVPLRTDAVAQHHQGRGLPLVRGHAAGQRRQPKGGL